MPRIRRRCERGFVDPLSLFGLLFLVITLAAITFVTANKGFSLNISEKASNNDYSLAKNNCDTCMQHADAASCTSVCSNPALTDPNAPPTVPNPTPVVPPPTPPTTPSTNVPTSGTGPKPGEFGYVYPGQLDQGFPFIAGTYISNGKRYLVASSGTAQAASNYYQSNPDKIVSANFSDSTKKELNLDAILQSSQQPTQTTIAPPATNTNTSSHTAYECASVQRGTYNSASGTCTTTSTSQTVEKTDEGFITHNTTFTRDAYTGKVLETKSLDYIAKTTTHTSKDQGLTGMQFHTTTSTTTFINPDTGKPYLDANGKPITNISTAVAGIPSGTSSQNKKADGSDCSNSSECGSGSCVGRSGGGQVVRSCAKTEVVAPLPDKRSDGEHCTYSYECGSGRCGGQAHGRGGPPTIQCLPQIVPDNNYGSCNGDAACNAALTSIDRGMTTITFGGWDNYKAAFAPGKIHYLWEEAGYKSVDDCREKKAAVQTRGRQSLDGCGDVLYTEEQIVSSIQVGTTLTIEGAAIFYALPAAAAASSPIAALAPTLSFVGAASTLSQTSNAVVAQIEDPFSKEANIQTGYAALSWLNIGTADKLVKSFQALETVGATAETISAVNSARNLNNLVSVVNFGVDAPNAISTCSQDGVLTGSCAGSLTAVVADIGFGFLDYHQGQLGFGDPLKNIKLNEPALVGALQDIPNPNDTRIATPAELDQVAQLLANPTGASLAFAVVAGEIKLTPSTQLDMFDLLTSGPTANTSTVLNNGTQLVFPDKPLANDPNTTFNLTKPDPNETSALAIFNQSDVTQDAASVAELLPSNLDSQIPNTPPRTDSNLANAPNIEPAVLKPDAPKPAELNIANDVTTPLTGTTNTTTPNIASFIDENITQPAHLNDPNASVLDKTKGIIEALPDTGGAIGIIKAVNKIEDEIASVFDPSKRLPIENKPSTKDLSQIQDEFNNISKEPAKPAAPEAPDIKTENAPIDPLRQEKIVEPVPAPASKPLSEKLFGEPKTIKVDGNSTGSITLRPGDTIVMPGRPPFKIPDPNEIPDLYWKNLNAEGDIPHKLTADGITFDLTQPKGTVLEIGPLDPTNPNWIDFSGNNDLSVKLYGKENAAPLVVIQGTEGTATITRANPEQGLLSAAGLTKTWDDYVTKPLGDFLFGNPLPKTIDTATIADLGAIKQPERVLTPEEIKKGADIIQSSVQDKFIKYYKAHGTLDGAEFEFKGRTWSAVFDKTSPTYISLKEQFGESAINNLINRLDDGLRKANPDFIFSPKERSANLVHITYPDISTDRLSSIDLIATYLEDGAPNIIKDFYAQHGIDINPKDINMWDYMTTGLGSETNITFKKFGGSIIQEIDDPIQGALLARASSSVPKELKGTGSLPMIEHRGSVDPEVKFEFGKKHIVLEGDVVKRNEIIGPVIAEPIRGVGATDAELAHLTNNVGFDSSITPQQIQQLLTPEQAAKFGLEPIDVELTDRVVAPIRAEVGSTDIPLGPKDIVSADLSPFSEAKEKIRAKYGSGSPEEKGFNVIVSKYLEDVANTNGDTYKFAGDGAEKIFLNGIAPEDLHEMVLLSNSMDIHIAEAFKGDLGPDAQAAAKSLDANFKDQVFVKVGAITTDATLTIHEATNGYIPTEINTTKSTDDFLTYSKKYKNENGTSKAIVSVSPELLAKFTPKELKDAGLYVIKDSKYGTFIGLLEEKPSFLEDVISGIKKFFSSTPPTVPPVVEIPKVEVPKDITAISKVTDTTTWPRKEDVKIPETGNYYLSRDLASGDLAPDLQPLKSHISDAAGLINTGKYDEALKLLGDNTVAKGLGVEIRLGKQVDLEGFDVNMTEQEFKFASDRIAKPASHKLGGIVKPAISGDIPQILKREEAIVLLEEWIHELQDRNALIHGVPVKSLLNNLDIEKEAALILKDLDVHLSEPYINRYQRADLNIEGQNLNSLEKAVAPVSVPPIVPKEPPLPQPKPKVTILGIEWNGIRDENGKLQFPIDLGIQFNGFKKEDGGFTLWPLEKTPPIKTGEVFDPSIEVNNILKSPTADRPAALAEYKTKLAYQQKGLAEVQTQIEAAIRENPDISTQQLVNMYENSGSKYGFTDLQKSKYSDAIQIYNRNHTRVNKILSDYPESGKLFEALFGRQPLGKVEIVKGPMTIDLKIENPEDFKYIVNTDFSSGVPVPASWAPTNETEGVVDLGKFLSQGTLLPNSNNLIITENGLNLPENTRIHEEQHAIFHQQPDTNINVLLLDAEEPYLDYKLAISNGQDALPSLTKYTNAVQTITDISTADEIIAMLKGNANDSSILTDLRDLSGYDFYSYTKDELSNFLKSEADAQTEIIDTVLSKTFSNDIYESKIKDGLEAFDNLTSKGYSRDQAIALLERQPLADWPKAAERATGPVAPSFFNKYIKGDDGTWFPSFRSKPVPVIIESAPQTITRGNAEITIDTNNGVVTKNPAPKTPAQIADPEDYAKQLDYDFKKPQAFYEKNGGKNGIPEYLGSTPEGGYKVSYIPGTTLSEFNGVLTPQEIESAVNKLKTQMDDSGFAHGDIGPENIIIATRPDGTHDINFIDYTGTSKSEFQKEYDLSSLRKELEYSNSKADNPINVTKDFADLENNKQTNFTIQKSGDQIVGITDESGNVIHVTKTLGKGSEGTVYLTQLNGDSPKSMAIKIELNDPAKQLNLIEQMNDINKIRTTLNEAGRPDLLQRIVQPYGPIHDDKGAFIGYAREFVDGNPKILGGELDPAAFTQKDIQDINDMLAILDKEGVIIHDLYPSNFIGKENAWVISDLSPQSELVHSSHPRSDISESLLTYGEENGYLIKRDAEKHPYYPYYYVTDPNGKTNKENFDFMLKYFDIKPSDAPLPWANEYINTKLEDLAKAPAIKSPYFIMGAFTGAIGVTYAYDKVAEYFGYDVINNNVFTNVWDGFKNLFVALPTDATKGTIKVAAVLPVSVPSAPEKVTAPVVPVIPAKTSEQILQEKILEITNSMRATTPEELAALFRSIGDKGAYVGSNGSLICGPLSMEILHRMGLFNGNYNDFYPFEPGLEMDKLLRDFPSDKFSITNTLKENHSIGDIQYWKDHPLKVGDFMFMETRGGARGFDHMLVVDKVDSQGRVYSTTNHFTITNGVTTYVVDRVLLYDPTNPNNPEAMFNKWTDRSLLNVNGNTGTGGFLVVSPKPENIQSSLNTQISPKNTAANQPSIVQIPDAEYTKNQFGQEFLYYNQFDYAGEKLKTLI